VIVHVHAIGDRAVKEALDGIAAARKANGNSGLPLPLRMNSSCSRRISLGSGNWA